MPANSFGEVEARVGTKGLGCVTRHPDTILDKSPNAESGKDQFLRTCAGQHVDTRTHLDNAGLLMP